jgi:23S rRNA pseudouridine2604 synthase
MADTPRKMLRLPAKVSRDDALPDTGRRLLRGSAPRVMRGQAAPAAASVAPKARAPLQQKPRGTPSRAPLVAKSAAPVRSTSAPALTSNSEKAAQSGVRISKLMAERGLCSRRDADVYIERGWVFVDGQRVTELGTRAPASAVIKLDKAARAAQQRQMTILLHKPVGYVSGQPEPGFTPAVTLVLPENQYRLPDTPVFQASCLRGLAPAGRLDIDSTGLLVLTQDGRVARRLIGEHSTIEKEYLVRVEGRLTAQGLALLNHGLSLDDKKLKPAQVEWLNDDQLRFVLIEGRKRQIRRMCELVGLRALGLKRVRIGQVKLGDLPLGQWRFLREDEVF